MSYNYECKIVWYAAKAGAKINPREMLKQTYPQLFVDWPDGHWDDWFCWVDGELRQVLVYRNDCLKGWYDEQYATVVRLRDVTENPPAELDSEIVILGEDWDDKEAHTNFGRATYGGMHLLSAERQIVFTCGREP